MVGENLTDASLPVSNNKQVSNVQLGVSERIVIGTAASASPNDFNVRKLGNELCYNVTKHRGH